MLLTALVAGAPVLPAGAWLNTTSGGEHARDYMDCGTAAVCGTITLETGLGSGNYRHDVPVVHGLWPSTGSYGSSPCVAPTKSTDDPTQVYDCYAQKGHTQSDDVDFETHEWESHGQCAGVKDADDYLTQICSLSSAPLALMADARTSGHTDLQGYVDVLTSKGYAVFDTDASNMQVELSACAGSDGQWQLADPSNFSTVCGSAA
jgi:hypothetical protein